MFLQQYLQTTKHVIHVVAQW